MLKSFLGKVIGDPNEREVRKLQPLVDAVNAREADMERRTNAELRALTDLFRARHTAGESLDDLLGEAFAAVREASKRTVSLRPFDVQIIGGAVLHRGTVSEMKTGEGKTLVATLPVYLNALSGRGVHLVTVNDYLARRDALWMGPIYHLLGLSVGLLQSGPDQPAYLVDPSYQKDPYPGLRPAPRREAYAADVTYGTNNEFGFDYLRDNLALSLAGRVQRPLWYAIVDEVDNIFIDEARTPLIISGRSGESVEEYGRFAAIARKLEPSVHYELDEKQRSVVLTDEGLAEVERETGIENIYDEANYRYVHFMEQALKAEVLFQEGRDYVRQRKQIVLIDQHTGRLMPNRRLSEGLHQAIEAKEGVPVQARDVTSATITIQNYFRMYKKLAGMSGTALTEGEEFWKIYKLDVLPIPTNRPMVRADYPDVVYRTEEAKLRAVVRELLACHSRGQPVLVGTTSVEMSERLSARLSGERIQMAALAPRVVAALQDAGVDREAKAKLREAMNSNLETTGSAAWRKLMRDLGLESAPLADDNVAWIADYLELPGDASTRQTLENALREGIPHQVLNAKEHAREATIIARAGEPGAVTIATNMAGRGVDIRLGGELTDEVIHRAHQALRARGLDPFRATSSQMDSAIAEVAPQYAKRRDQVLAAGGLHILGTERHEARRIDNQLRGRSGRQGEPGSSRFYLSLEDDLMRRFGRKEMLGKLMEQIGDDFPIEHSLVSKTLERAQTSVEGYNFDIRKHLLEYDDVLNRQRDSIYTERLRLIQADDVRPEVRRMLEGQVDEYLAKVGDDPDQLRLLFAGLDDVVPLILPAPSAAFRGPLPFGSHLTAFPPFTVSFLADQFADQPLDQARQAVHDLPRRAAAAYSDQVRRAAEETVQATLDKYAERLDRFRALLDEKIEDYSRILEERNEQLDLRRLAQHLDRTYPFKLSSPAESVAAGLDELRDSWLAQVDVEFHRQTIAGLIDRYQSRLPAEAGANLDRTRPALLPPDRLTEELRRVLDLAEKQAGDEAARRSLARLAPPSGGIPDAVWDLIAEVKRHSDLDYGRLDRLVGHVLGAQMDDLLAQFQEAAGPEQGRLRRELERLRDSTVEGKKGGRTGLAELLHQLNSLVHVEVEDAAALLSRAVSHEFDKWAQRQVAEIESAGRTPLAEPSWPAIAGHLLAILYTQKQGFDREHRRQTAWMPRLPLGFLAQAAAEGLAADELREAILASLLWAVELREQTWGRQELQRWGSLSLPSLEADLRDALVRALGEAELGSHMADRVDELPGDLLDYLQFALSAQQLQDRRLSDLPGSEELLARLAKDLETHLLDTPLRDLDPDFQARIGERLRAGDLLHDPAARAQLLDQPIRDWDRRTRDEAAAFWGSRAVEENQAIQIAALAPPTRDLVVAYLQRQRRFVDEEHVQRFLVHQGLRDLPSETRQAALLRLARLRLERIGRRKISGLDLATRQQVTASLQSQGLFTDQARRDGLLDRSLSNLEPHVRAGFGIALARQAWEAAGSLAALDAPLRSAALERLRHSDLAANSERLQAFPRLRLSELDTPLAAPLRDELLAGLRSDLASRTMGELPETTRRRVHAALDEQDYFTDQERASWYERRTLAQLAPELLHGLEQYVGAILLSELAATPFRELPRTTQQELIALFDAEGLLSERAERLRLTQTGALADLSARERSTVVRHLGRQWLVSVRDRRPSALPDRDREWAWSFLRDQGTFRDEFKEELFAYQRLDEFDPATRLAVESSAVARFEEMLDTHPIAELPADLQAAIAGRLRQAGFFLDTQRLAEAESAHPADLPAGLRAAVEEAIAEHLLSHPAGAGTAAPSLADTPVGQLPAGLHAALWRHLDQIGYFLDEKRRAQILDRRLVDLGGEVLERAASDLASYLGSEIGSRLVSELDDDLRQGLREAVEALGHFESVQERDRLLSRPLSALGRADLEALATELGQARLAAWADQRLADLPEADRQALLLHLAARDWFLDRARLEQLQSRRLRELAAGLEPGLVPGLLRDQLERLRQRRLADLPPETHHAVHQALYEQGLRLDESQMRPLRARPVRELEPEVLGALLRELGGQVVAGWGAARFQDLEPADQDRLALFLGRRIMGRIERRVLLFTISRLWIDYLTDIEDLRRGIGLEAYGQRDPLVEYKRKAFELFEELAQNIRRDVVRSLFRQPPEALRA